MGKDYTTSMQFLKSNHKSDKSDKQNNSSQVQLTIPSNVKYFINPENYSLQMYATRDDDKFPEDIKNFIEIPEGLYNYFLLEENDYFKYIYPTFEDTGIYSDFKPGFIYNRKKFVDNYNKYELNKEEARLYLLDYYKSLGYNALNMPMIPFGYDVVSEANRIKLMLSGLDNNAQFNQGYELPNGFQSVRLKMSQDMLEASLRLKDAELALELFKYIPLLRTWGASNIATQQARLHNKEGKLAADMESAFGAVGDFADLFYGGGLGTVARTYAGDVAGRYVGEKYDHPILGGVIGATLAGASPWLYNWTRTNIGSKGSRLAYVMNKNLQNPVNVESQGRFLKLWGGNLWNPELLRLDPLNFNITERFGIAGLPERGYFELVKDNEPGFYSVHFKPTITKSNAFSSLEKDALFQTLADNIPEGGSVSTWGYLTKGGIAGINRFGKMGFIKTGTRPVHMKSGEPINIPIYTKNKPTILDFTLSNNGHDNNQITLTFEPFLMTPLLFTKQFRKLGKLKYDPKEWTYKSELGKYIGEGEESVVFENGNKVYKVLHTPPSYINKNAKYQNFGLNELEELHTKYIDPLNRHTIFSPLSFEGIIEDSGTMIPVLSLDKLSPIVSIEETISPDAENLIKTLLSLELTKLGYKPKEFKLPFGHKTEGFISPFGKTIYDLHPYNLGYDNNGKLKVFDMMIYKQGGKVNETCIET